MDFKDQLGRTITLNHPPRRIISIVPSQTELLFDLGLDEEVVGITKFCIHPKEMWRSKPRVGGTKNVKIEKVRELNPDLIIANKEENNKDDILQLEEEFPVWISDIGTVEEALQMIIQVSILVGKEEKGTKICSSIQQSWGEVKGIIDPAKVLYFIWRKPWMISGQGTFINDTIEWLGLSNAVESSRYPEIAEEEMRGLDVQYVFLSSEPYPFKDEHIKELQAVLPNAKIILVDGEMFSWYGTRMLHAPDYFRTMDLKRRPLI